MSPFKLTGAIILYFLARSAFSACEPYQGIISEYSICWKDDIKAYVSESCLNSKCDALHKPSFKKETLDRSGGRNPAAVRCKEFGHKIVILKDENNDELSFCQFPDGSLIDVFSVKEGQ